MSLFAAVEMAPRDPILGLNEQFNADPNPNKVNLGVGVYYDDNGKLPLLECVQQAEAELMEAPQPRGYLPIDGIAAYDKAVQELVFGADSDRVKTGRVATVQALGGTGGLKIGADFLQARQPGRAGADQRPELGKPPRAVRAAPASTVEHLPVLRRRRRAASTSTACWRRSNGCRPARSSCCTPAATTRPATTSPPTQWDAGDRGRQGARPGAVPRHGLPGLRRRHRRRRRGDRASSSQPASTSSSRPRSRRASRSTASASARCQVRLRDARKKRRACCRSSSA